MSIYWRWRKRPRRHSSSRRTAKKVTNALRNRLAESLASEVRQHLGQPMKRSRSMAIGRVSVWGLIAGCAPLTPDVCWDGIQVGRVSLRPSRRISNMTISQQRPHKGSHSSYSLCPDYFYQIVNFADDVHFRKRNRNFFISISRLMLRCACAGSFNNFSDSEEGWQKGHKPATWVKMSRVKGNISSTRVARKAAAKA